MPTIRSSKLDLAWKCAASAERVQGEVQVDSSDDASELGNAVHRYLACRVRGVELDQATLAVEHGVDADELGFLCGRGRALLERLGAYVDLSGAHTELPLAGAIGDTAVTGTADLATPPTNGSIVVVDHKSGRLDSSHVHQTSSYGLMWLERQTEPVNEIVTITGRLRDGDWDIVKYTPEQLQDWRDEFARRLANGRGNFNPGSHCQYCPRASACPGRRAMVQAAVADLTEKGLNVLTWTAETRQELGPQIGEMFGRMKLVENIAAQFRDAVRADVERHGDLFTGPGRKLSLVTVNRRVLDPAKTRAAVLGKFADQDNLDAATTIGVGKLEERLMAASEHGSGARKKREMAAALEEAGAVTVKEERQLRETRA